MTRTAALPRELRTRLADLSIRDEHRLRRRLDKARGGDLAELENDIATAEQRIAKRRAAVPSIGYPEQLPVSARREDIAAAIAAHQVVVIAGETGSGKTTQIPKICLELGRGIRGTIGHTQPRRLAARTVAERIAEELGTELGDVIGYTVRFTDQASDRTLVKLMTDGILLAEIQRDRMLRRYDTIIIDEAHERSLNIDFLLGYLKQLLPRRPDLKVIITSATIDPELFARHFADEKGTPAPIVEVSGRSYPVELRYRPLALQISAPAGDGEDDEDDDPRIVDRDPVDAIGDAVTELLSEGDGDVLVFLSGEREIRDTADALRDLKLPRTEILPLYARLSAAEQHRVFQPHTGRRVVLATNVAETSLTVPGIRYVVDPGTARISRYSMRTKVQRLPIEPISQASARQRSGRCGRVADGICIRLYSEDDFDARPAFTEPEILRTNLAAVILQMTALGLGDIENFPFVEPPDRRAIRDGIALLEELGALTRKPTPTPRSTDRGDAPADAATEDADRGDGKRADRAAAVGDLALTAVGREMAQIPVDPRMARMLVEANATGCLPEVLVIVAALSIQDVRERPAEAQQAADAKHARFVVEGSDFLAHLRLWDYLRTQRKALSSNQFRRMCRDEFLHYLRIREWQDLHGQLRTITRGLGWSSEGSLAPVGESDGLPWDSAAVHRALLAGMLSHIGLREGETREFLGARNAKFMIFPGSSLAKKPPRWVMAAELVETSRLWGRMAGRIEPEWAEKLAGDLVKRQYSEPHWSARRGAAMAYERVTLYGIPLVTQRRVDFGRIDPELARELFLRHALVQGEWQTRHEFFQRNRDLLEDVADLENRARRRDILVDDQVLFDFYDRRVPADVVSVRHFDSWWRKAARKDPTLLDFSTSTVVNEDAAVLDPTAFPDSWRQGELTFGLTYQFEPGQADDGVTVHIPVAQLAHVRAVGFDWLVPGMREELAAALIKTLPKQLRRSVVPAPDFAAAALARLTPRAEPLRTGLARELSRLGSVTITPADLDPAALPDHLRMTFAAIAADGSVAARGKNLAELKTRLADQVSKSVARATSAAERPAATVWTSESLGTLAPTVRREVGGQTITGYPALVPEGDGVAVRVLSSPAAQAAAMRAGTRALLLRRLPTSPRGLTAGLSAADRLALSQNPYGSLDALIEDCRACAADELIAARGGPVRSPDRFQQLVDAIRPEFGDAVARVLRLAVPVLAEAHRVRTALSGTADREIAEDVGAQLDELVFAGFIAEFGSARLRELPRYLQAAVVRLEALPASAQRDHQGMVELDRVHAAYQRLLDSVAPGRRTAPEVTEIWWMIEEFRVSLFAQQLGTPYPVSAKRIERAITAVRSAPARR
ncbi:ATP-dependent RNA helicase HrpA [Nocardia terpenica]|uniref:ATP-dependent RNA helicase HrpA n=1 Tax=Nocardia terpenica TaxID=455432 RepID=UPI0018933B46|nr:ATP-dependent RNA helicase HrpA [Nocardia terpenica]MBF6065596.1 ATP-dependent RNA helicase HrpA [Nocardia terpenica]MBF6108602.1 ATP-dependent RNA helicase HrpA [Nocardia terpenica]MBF6115632.1 ATP-dependent RNA helicase HrpA [Nocardia terpenica]MBF6122841.1 ATP-dependent RNA helicase HrpA [Nocardia terpenica]MBF6155807.1 ATP-dependent RNA helicase HrpA [Nocardia terpenica]